MCAKRYLEINWNPVIKLFSSFSSSGGDHLHPLFRLRLVRWKITEIDATGKYFPGWWNFLGGQKKDPPPPVFSKTEELLAKITKNFL
jgi:hypothetical protein